MWYIILVTAFTNFVLGATIGLLHDVLLQIPLSFTLIFYLLSIMIGGKRARLNLKNLCYFVTFQFSLLYVFTFTTNKNYVCRYKI